MCLHTHGHSHYYTNTHLDSSEGQIYEENVSPFFHKTKKEPPLMTWGLEGEKLIKHILSLVMI